MNEKCILCNSTNLELLGTTKTEVFVAGDRRDFDKGNREIKRVICKNCGMVQFLQNEDYHSAVNEVFKGYGAMFLKTWIDSEEGHKAKPQLQAEYERINAAIRLPGKGKMLDLGCGNGDSLFQFHKIWPEWDLYGMDIGKQFEQSVMEQEGVKGFFSSLDRLKKSNLKFDFVSLNRMLCEVPNPIEMLETVYDILAENGICIILDTDFDVHPWILYTIDMCSVYTKGQLDDILQGVGFSILDVEFEHEEKELVVFGTKKGNDRKQFSNLYELNKKIYNQKISFLNNVTDVVREYVNKYTHIGIFGTSLAGVWVSEIIQKENIENSGKQIFYVEEDEEGLRKKIGANGYPIYRLEEISEDAVIFLPFPKYVVESILRRVESAYGHLKFINFYGEDV